MTIPADDDLPTTDEGWDELRAYFDRVGQNSLEKVEGVSSEVAGQRIAHFNDMLVERLKKEAERRRKGNP